LVKVSNYSRVCHQFLHQSDDLWIDVGENDELQQPDYTLFSLRAGSALV